MKKLLLALMAMMLVCGFTVYAEEGKTGGGDAEVQKTKVDLEKLPKEVKEAATKAVEGIVLKEAHMAKTDAGVVYTIAGVVGEKRWIVKVTVDADGKVTGTDAKAAEEKKEGGDQK